MLPPPALKARIMAEVEREAALLASAGEPDRRSRRSKRRRVLASAAARSRFPRAAIGALACLLVAAVSRSARWCSAASGARTIDFQSTIQQASAELEITDDSATLVANDLPPARRARPTWSGSQRPGHAPEPTSALFTPRRDGSATASA